MPTPFWWWLMAFFAFVVFFFIRSILQKRAQFRYVKEAQKELTRLSGTYSCENAKALLELQKRVAITAYGREKVASLTQNKWLQFMQKHSEVNVDEHLVQLYEKILYQPLCTLSKEEFESVVSLTKIWIQTHKEKKDV